MSRDISGARWPPFMLQIQEIKPRKGVTGGFSPQGVYEPPKRMVPRTGTRINSRLFYCDTRTMRPFRLDQNQLPDEYSPLPPFAIYHYKNQVHAWEGEVLNGVGALGPISSDYDSDDTEEDIPWRHINFTHEEDNTSYVGIAGDKSTMNPHGHTSSAARKLIPRAYRAERESGSSGGLCGHVQLLLGLLRFFEKPGEEDFTTVSKMRDGTWRIRADLPSRMDERGIVVRVWALPDRNIQELDDFGVGEQGAVFE